MHVKSHTGDLLQLVSVHRRPSWCGMHCALTIEDF